MWHDSLLPDVAHWQVADAVIDAPHSLKATSNWSFGLCCKIGPARNTI